MPFNVLLLAILISSCALKNDPKKEEVNCAQSFEQSLASFIDQPKVHTFGTYESTSETQLRGMPLECGIQIKKLKNSEAHYSIFVGRDTKPRGNPRKIFDDNLKLKSCKDNKFELQSIEREDIIVIFSLSEKSLTLSGNSSRLENFSCKNISL